MPHGIFDHFYRIGGAILTPPCRVPHLWKSNDRIADPPNTSSIHPSIHPSGGLRRKVQEIIASRPSAAEIPERIEAAAEAARVSNIQELLKVLEDLFPKGHLIYIA